MREMNKCFQSNFSVSFGVGGVGGYGKGWGEQKLQFFVYLFHTPSQAPGNSTVMYPNGRKSMQCLAGCYFLVANICYALNALIWKDKTNFFGLRPL